MVVNVGIAVPANAAEQQVIESINKMQQRGHFREKDVPDMVEYALFREDGHLLKTSMSKRQLEQAKNFYDSGNNGSFFYHKSVDTKEGICVMQYRIQMQLTNPVLRRMLPFFEPAFVSFFILLGIFFIAFITRQYVKKMRESLRPLDQMVSNLTRGDLETKVVFSNVKEYNEVLESMEMLQNALKESLEQQWKLEQEKEEQTRALIHDLRTPLTVIDGNAQLLEEEVHSDEQAMCIEAILRNTKAAQDYVIKLRETIVNGADFAERESITIEKFLMGIQKQSEELCKIHQINLKWNNKISIEVMKNCKLYLEKQNCFRAIINLVLNAVQYSAYEGDVIIRSELVFKKEREELCLTITDSGDGFSKKALLHGTEAFFTEDEGRIQGGHMGNGLFFAKKVIEGNGGSLLISNSQKGHGQVKVHLLVSSRKTCHQEKDTL